MTTGPNDGCENEFAPNAASHLFRANRRVFAEKGPHEDGRCEDEPGEKLEESKQHPAPARCLRIHEWPELLVALRAEMHVMRLVRCTVEREAREAQDADQHPIEFVEAAVLSQKAMRGFVKADEQAVHEMAREEDQGHSKPVPSAIDTVEGH
jgi:hypothetical protein